MIRFPKNKKAIINWVALYFLLFFVSMQSVHSKERDFVDQKKAFSEVKFKKGLVFYGEGLSLRHRRAEKK
jgi:hypothetical protein